MLTGPAVGLLALGTQLLRYPEWSVRGVHPTGLPRQGCLFHQGRVRQLLLALLQVPCSGPAERRAGAGGGESGAFMHLPGEGGSKSATWLTSLEYWGDKLSCPSVPRGPFWGPHC